MNVLSLCVTTYVVIGLCLNYVRHIIKHFSDERKMFKYIIVVPMFTLGWPICLYIHYKSYLKHKKKNGEV